MQNHVDVLTLLLSTAQLSNKLYFSASDVILNFNFFPFFLEIQTFIL